MALGSIPEESVTAFDECKQATITYITSELYLDAFDCYNGDQPMEGIGIHVYDNSVVLELMVDVAYARYGIPVWVTEFALPFVNDAALQAFMVEALDFLERAPKVAGYAWFKADPVFQPGLTGVHLVTVGSRGNPIELTPLGEIYVNFPAYDPNYYHPVPGKIEAESYCESDNLFIQVAYDPEGVAAMSGGRQSGSLSYQIDVATAGRYQLRMRISSSGFSDQAPDDGSGYPDPATGKERDLLFELDLEQGEQVLKLMFKGLNAKVDWLELELLP
jgi:hypothetical protein